MNDRQGKRASSPRMKQRRRRRRIRTFWLCVLLVAVVAAITGVVFLRTDNQRDNSWDDYHVLDELSLSNTQGIEQTAPGFAADLCVGEPNIALENVQLAQQESAALFDLDAETTLYAQNLYERIYPASITKIMTGLLALEYGNADEIVTISESAVTLEAGSQVCGFKAGDQVSLGTLIRCLMVYSGNDAASAIAESIAGSESAFVDLMNQRAQGLGMTGTHYTNAHGLQDENHYTTVYDIYLLLNEASKNQEFLSIIQLDSYVASYNHADGTPVEMNLDATDLYLIGQATPPINVTILGGKTGTTSQAGHCLALLSQNAYGNPFISIVTNAESEEALYEQMNILLSQINS